MPKFNVKVYNLIYQNLHIHDMSCKSDKTPHINMPVWFKKFNSERVPLCRDLTYDAKYNPREFKSAVKHYLQRDNPGYKQYIEHRDPNEATDLVAPFIDSETLYEMK